MQPGPRSKKLFSHGSSPGKALRLSLAIPLTAAAVQWERNLASHSTACSFVPRFLTSALWKLSRDTNPVSETSC